MAVNEVVGGKEPQDTIDQPVAYEAGQGEIEACQRADSLQDLCFGSAGEIGRDHFRRPAGGVNVGSQVRADGIKSVLLQKDPVKFALDLFVGDFSAGGQGVDIAVACPVEGEVAEETAQIGEVLPAGASLQIDLSRRRKEFFARKAVHAAPLGVERVMGERFIIKEQNKYDTGEWEQIPLFNCK